MIGGLVVRIVSDIPALAASSQSAPFFLAAVRHRGEELVALLTTAGFVQASFIYEKLKRGPAVYVTGQLPGTGS